MATDMCLDLAHQVSLPNSLLAALISGPRVRNSIAELKNGCVSRSSAEDLFSTSTCERREG